MTDQKIVKLEKEIQKKITVSDDKTIKSGSVFDIDKAKKLAKKLNTIESQPPHATAI